MGRAIQRAERIREQIPIIQVLADYGYYVDPEGDDREQQFQCDLHGDGQDNKPSARVYPESGSWYCFACGRSRDAIQLVREKEGLDFSPACKLLENRYGLPPLPWDGGPREATPEEEIREALTPSRTLGDEQSRVSRLLDNLTREKDLLVETTLSLWEAFDKIVWVHEQGRIEDRAAQEALLRLRGIVMGKLKEQV